MYQTNVNMRSSSYFRSSYTDSSYETDFNMYTKLHVNSSNSDIFKEQGTPKLLGGVSQICSSPGVFPNPETQIPKGFPGF